MPYRPDPIDTSGVRLPEELFELTEKLARNVHDHWAAARVREGWGFGPARDDGAKRHPNLVPYDELPEGEKEVDRRSALETVKALLALGYRITRGGGGGG